MKKIVFAAAAAGLMSLAACSGSNTTADNSDAMMSNMDMGANDMDMTMDNSTDMTQPMMDNSMMMDNGMDNGAMMSNDSNPM